VPPSWVYTRFLKLLFEFKSEVDAMFDRLVDELKGLLPDLGFSVAVDSKGVDSGGRPTKENKRDGRRDMDADWGKKAYHGQREDGTLWEKVVTWFGYKIHLLVDTQYEMPISYQVTKASASDTKRLLPLVRRRRRNIWRFTGTSIGQRRIRGMIVRTTVVGFTMSMGLSR